MLEGAVMRELKFELKSIPKCDLSVIDSFDELPDDAFLKGDFRFRKRRYGLGTLSSGGVKWVDRADAFYQSELINSYSGGMKRYYDPIGLCVKEYVDTVLIKEVSEFLPSAFYSLGVHQMRVVTENNRIGMPAPEGIHQDGFDFVVTACVSVNNIVGGNSILVDSKDHGNLVYEKILNPFEMLLFDDRIHAHYVSPIVPKMPGKGFRDVFVLTFKALP
jgi:hypothetical protein